MKVQTLQRAPGSVQRETSGDLRRHARNLNPQYHPMPRARELARAVTAAKLDRMFAQPLVGSLGEGHADAVTTSAVSRRALLPLVSGAADGTVHLWDLASRTCVGQMPAHSRVVTGVTFGVSGQNFYSCSDDGLIHQWSIHAQSNPAQDEPDHEETALKRTSRKSMAASTSSSSPHSNPRHGPLATWRTSGSFKSIDHHWMEEQFATASDEAVQIWTPTRSTALQTFADLWGSDDTVTTVRYHPAERSLLGLCAADRGVGLYDTRTGTALKKTVLRLRSNDLQWNPMEPLNFLVANDDYQIYLFDMRKLEAPVRIYKGHTGAVLSVAWSPTGQEFASASYDRTLRIFPYRPGGQARDIYHTKRMQRVTTVQYSLDHQYIISGSDDSNLRVWKAQASAPLGQLNTRQESALQYRQALIHKYQHAPAVRNIHRHRKIPKTIKKQTAQAVIQKESADRKQANRVKYDRKGQHVFVSERKTTVVKQID